MKATASSLHNMTGNGGRAVGDDALANNTDGDNDTAIGVNKPATQVAEK